MNYVSRHWKGELSIAKSFWLGQLVMALITVPLSFYFMAVTNHIGAGEVLTLFKTGKIYILRSPPRYMQVIEEALFVSLFIWWIVGVWRSCNNPLNNKKRPSRRLIIKTFLLLSIGWQIYDVQSSAMSIVTGKKPIAEQKEASFSKFMAAAINEQVNQCWDIPKNLTKEEQMPVEILITVNPDRYITDAHVVDSARLSSDQNFKIMADSALQALNKPECKRLDLPGDYYETWKQIDFTFYPQKREE